MDGDEDEDCEVVLKDSELYKYLLNCNANDFDVYDKNCLTEERSNCDIAVKKPVTKVPTELLIYLDTILNSNVLLDEDVTYLYGFTIDLISDLKVRKFLDIVFSSCIGLSSLAVAINYNSLIQNNHIFIFLSAIKNYFIKWQRRKALNELITIVKQIHLYFKKTLQILYEQNAYYKLQHLKFKTNGKADDIDVDLLEKKKKSEVDTLSIILCRCISENIIETKDCIKALVNNLPLVHPIDSREHYLAFMQDSQLGIDKYSSIDPSCAGTPPLDTLKNVYLLMQSEFFRRLGLCFCPTVCSYKLSGSFLSSIFEVVINYSKLCRGTLSVIKFYYKKHVFPASKDKSRPKDSASVGGNNAIHKVSTGLNELVTDSRLLEEYVENLKRFDDGEIDIICRRLVELKRGLENSIESVHSAEKFFSKLRRNGEIKREITDETRKVENKDVREAVEVGKLSRNMDSKDHVYFAVTEGATRDDNDLYRNPDDTVPVKLPAFLLSELKQVLIDKRTEFTDRENNAVDNPEEYKKFLESQEITDNESKRERARETVSYNGACDLQMHKLLASAVAQRSNIFMKHEEEQFGSSDESDSDGQS